MVVSNLHCISRAGRELRLLLSCSRSAIVKGLGGLAMRSVLRLLHSFPFDSWA